MADYRILLGVKVNTSDIRTQISKYNGNSNNAKLRLGVKLDTKNISSQIKAINTKTPVTVGLKLDTKNALKQLNDIRGKMQQLGNITISWGNGNGGNGGRQVTDVTRAYRELMGVLNELQSKRIQLNGLDSSSASSSRQVQTLLLQIQQLENEYNNLINAFRQQGIQFSAEQWNEIGTAMARTGRQIDVVQAKMADKSAVQSQTQAYRELLSISKEISSLEINIAKLRGQGGNASQIAELENQLRVLQTTYQQVVTTMNTPLTADQWSSIYAQIAKTQEGLSLLNAKVADTRANLASDIQLKVNTNVINNQISALEVKFGSLKNKTAELTYGMESVRTASTNLNAAIQSGNVDNIISSYESYKRVLQDVTNQINIQARAEQQYAAQKKLLQDRANLSLDMSAWLKNNSAAANQFGDRVRQLQAELKTCDSTRLSGIRSEFQSIKREADLAGKAGLTFADRLKKQFSRFSTYFSVSMMIMQTIRALRDMFNQVKAIDSALTELKKVTDETDATYNEFLTNAASRAKEIGTTIDGLVASTADFARLGYGFKDAQGLAEVANIYAVVGDEVKGVEGATESLISTMAAFKDEISGLSNEDFAMDIIDKFNEIGNNFAISSGGIGEALTRSASSLAAANNTLDESIALITAANTVVQDPDVVGTAFKTISMRIRGAKTELEEAGLETDGMVDSVATLRQEILALSGVDIMENDDTFKSTYKIIEELSDKWKDLSDIQQATITELIAGKRQGNIVSSLMTNFDIAQKALQTSINSEGSALTEHEKWMKSIEAGINRVKAAWQSLSQSFLESGFLKGLLKTVESLINGFEKLVSTFGTIPTLLGLFTGIKTLFYGNGGLFNFNKETRSIQILGNSFSALGKEYATVSTKINKYNSLNVANQTKFCNSMKNSNTNFGRYISGLNGSKASMSGYIASLIKGKIATIGLQAATTALNIALTMGISFAISKIIGLISKWANAEEELAEKVEEITAKFKEQQGELVKNKESFKTEAARYSELSKGVGNLGENISLTSDEYSEYQNIVNSIAGQIPSLVAGYDSQGNAILNVKGNVEELTSAYEKLIHLQNQEVLTKSNDIEEDFDNTVKDNSSHGFWKSFVTNAGFGSFIDYDLTTNSVEALNKLLNAEVNGDDVDRLIDEIEYNKYLFGEVNTALKNAGVDTGALGTNFSEALKKVLENEPNKIKGIIDNFYDKLDVDGMKTLAQATISEAFDVSSEISGMDYSNISDSLQNVARQVVNSLDYDFYSELRDNGESVETWVKNMLDQFNKIGKGDAAKFETAFNLQTQFNSGEISYGEYVNGIKDISKLIDSLGLDEEVKSQIKLSLNADEVTEEYEALKKRLSDKYKNETLDSVGADLSISATELEIVTKEAEEKAEKFLNELSISEYKVAVDLIANEEIDLSNFNIDSLRDYIEKQAKLNEAMNFTIAMDVETGSIEALNTAMAESISGAGLSSEAITALKGRYAELASQGYDLSAMFEETSNGIHLNRNAVNELEQALASQKFSETQSNLDVLKDRYDELTEEIKTCTDAGKRANLYTEQQQIAQKINDLATLASQYEGLTSAYQAWQRVEESGSERNMYESIIEGFETVGDEIKRGWLDDGTVKFLELLTGRTDLATLSAKELKEVYKGLDKEIKNTSYSVRDFFTVDEDGNSTSTGVYNFLKAVEELKKNGVFKGKENLDKLIQKDEKTGKITGFNFDVVGGDEAIAEALGISEELVQIMQRAADDAGFVVTLDGNYTQLADLKTSAETANDTLKKFKSEGLDGLKDADLNFDFSANNLESLNAQLEKSLNVLNKFKDKNGNLKTDKNGNLVEGAEEALEIASYFTATIDKLSEPVYMQLETNQVEKDLQKPLENMQEFERLSKEKHQLQLVNDTEGIKKVDKEMNEIAKYLDELDEETQIKLGIEGLTQEEIKSKLEKGEIEIPATVDIQMEMSEDIKDMRLMMMNQLGLISDEQLKLELEYDIDTSAVDDYTPEQQKAVVEYFAEHDEVDNYTPEQKKAVVKLVAEKENIDDWSIEEVEATIKYFVDDSDLKEWTPLEKRGLAKYIADGGELEGWTPEEKRGIAKYIADGNDVEGWTPEEKKAIARYIADGGDVSKYTPEEKRAFAKYLVDGGDPENYQPPDKTATAKYNKDSSEPDGYQPEDKEAKVTFWAQIKKIGSDLWGWITGGGGGAGPRKVVDGTANAEGAAFVKGTAKTSGKAYKNGNWRTKRTETALTGELGREIVVTPDNQWYTVGDNGAEFATIPRGSIVFNHRQSEELFKNGKVTSGGGRGRLLANGTAFANGTAYQGGTGGGIEAEVTSYAVGKNSNTGKTYYESTNDAKEDFQELFDLIETAIDRIERDIDRLDIKANSVYRSWSERNNALTEQISKVRDEINLQQSAYEEYMTAANSTGLSSSWIEKIRNGELDIETVTDEVLAEKISDYQEWYEKALDCKDAILELTEAESELIQQKFDNVIDRYDGYLSIIEHEKNILDEYISQSEAQGWLVSEKYYKALIDNEQDNIDMLEQEKEELLAELGNTEKGTQQWYDNVAAIDEVTEAIEAGKTAILEYEQAIQQLEWEVFDLLQDKISAVTEEADFLIELLSSDKLHDDNGQLTNAGLSTIGLHGQNYNTYMYQADLAAEEAKRLEKELKKDPYDTALEERYREMVSLQQEMILAAEDEKNAIRDLVEEGIELELDALQERIDAYNDNLDAAKDLYEYNKRVEEQTKNIASLRKQLAAIDNDDSEEAKAKIQQLKVELEEAETELEETEYDKYITDTEKLLDDLYLEYETILNERLDNIDALITDMIVEINANAGVISSTITEASDEVGYTLSDSMSTIWDENSTKINDVITQYGKEFSSKQTTTNTALSNINTGIQNMVSKLNSIANNNVKSASTSSAANPVKNNTGNNNSNKNNTNNESKKPTSGDGTPKVGDKVKFISGKYYYDSYGTKPLGSKYQGKEVYITNINKKGSHPYHVSTGNKIGKGDLGWLKLNQISGYATGKHNFLGDEVAWTQENGKEFIVRPSDGAILTPIAKGDSVLTSTASNNIWNMANSPTEFIKDNLNLGANVPNGSTMQSVQQNFENITFSLPNVRNYEELLASLQKDPKFDKLIKAMTIDQIAGKSSLAKGKALR